MISRNLKVDFYHDYTTSPDSVVCSTNKNGWKSGCVRAQTIEAIVLFETNTKDLSDLI